MIAPSLSPAPTLALISHPRAQNHLPIGAPPAASIEHRRVAISAAPRLQVAPLVRTVTTSSLSLRAITTIFRASERPTLPHGHESTMD
jgi:hypothetical protein